MGLPVTVKGLLEAGVHFGHQTKRWSPKMKEYIFGARSGIYIIDLQKTLDLFAAARDFVRRTAARGESILFVGTKKQAQDVIADEAGRCGDFYVNRRWLGGMLTNFPTIRMNVARLKKIEDLQASGAVERRTKKEGYRLEKERNKLQRALEGIREMKRLPGAVFVVDVRREKIAVAEARKLTIPIVAVVDTNCDPEGIEYVVPGNDDAIRAIRLFASGIADAVLEGKAEREQHLVTEPVPPPPPPPGGPVIERRVRAVPPPTVARVLAADLEEASDEEESEEA